MSIDGSFRLESALERFLASCPKLGSLPQYVSLTRKGSLVTEEEVVNLVAEQFVHPNYTIPLVGCFRPIARKIVDRAVALLHLVPNLRSVSEDVMDCDEAEINVIGIYAQTGRGLNLHELACLAFCRALDLAPFLLGSILTYFEFAPPPFERLLVKGTVLDLSVQVGTQLLLAARTSYRFLITDSEVFSTLWDWSCFLELVDQSSDLDLGSSGEIKKNIADIKWCGIQILSIMLHLSDRAVAKFGVKSEEAFACFLRWQEFCHDVSLEKAGMYIDTTKQMKSNIVNVNTDFSHENCLQSFGFGSPIISRFHEPELSVKNPRLEIRDKKSDTNPFVLTSSLRKSYNIVLLAVSQKWPVLLYGPASSGKSALISKLASDSGNQVLSIHMDDQIDGKTLIGSYVCTDQPGEFRWQPGSLAQAVQNGFWVIFEDIDKASSDVQSILLPLLEGASSFVTNQGEEIRVAESFRLFATVSTYKLDASQSTKGAGSSGALWRRMMIGPPSDDDLQDIIKAWFPNLECLAAKLIETFRKVNSASPLQPVASQPINSTCLSFLSRFSPRDLLKWCKRIAGLGFSFLGDGLSAYECHCIYQEAVDIFASFSISVEKRLMTMKDIAKTWAVPLAAAHSLYPHHKPVIQDLPSELQIGRITLQHTQIHSQKQIFVGIRSSLHVLERIACCVKYNEPVLLVGETGTGKTTLVQYLATRLGQRLTVLNLCQQSDVADLLGGFKPMDAWFICISLYKDFEALFSKTFSPKVSDAFLSRLQKHLEEKNWKLLLSGFQKAIDSFQKSVEMSKSESGEKRKKPLSKEKMKAWDNFSTRLKNTHRQVDASSGMVFSFVEGAFITALRNGEWILLDEVNLAPPETLQRIAGVLEGENSSLCLAERGDANYICRNPNFRIFACMNPATDSGKRDLPYSLRSRFTEFFVDDVLDDEDLTLFINQFMNYGQSSRELVNKIVCFYKATKKDSGERLQDGANQKPQYSLRSLYRALEYAREATKKFKFQKAIYDGFYMFFLSLLDRPSAKIMNQMILSYLLGGKLPQDLPFDRYLSVQDYKYNAFSENYVLTKTVREHLKNLSRAIFIKRYPVLLQGPTSSGKTSLVQYLAAITGHEFVRINNHEFTDLQEYLGSYVTDACGKLVFHEGVLVKAVRNGYWIVLDELNLAPSDVLEALNRLLDDNRELYVPELDETVRAHDDFMLFATQNPPTFYGGRKMLSRAFRNRFVEIHVDEIPEEELSTIIEGRCKIPKSHTVKMVEVMKDLQLCRQSSKVFAGKHGFITPRDLFRWADRSLGNSHHTEKFSYEDLARDGYYLLAERLRDDSEKTVVQEVLERHLHVKLIKEEMYMQESVGLDLVLNLGNHAGVAKALGNVIWTRSMLRLYFLVHRCYQLREPVLLVGETGGGKTTVCQLLSIILDLELHILNCHHYTETSDFIGGFYPIRERSKLMSEYKYQIEQLKLSKAIACFPTPYTISTDIGQASSTLDQLNIIINSYKQGLVSSPDVTLQDLDSFEQMKTGLSQLHHKWQMIFMWNDGPLVQAMKAGHLFLVDEISLADDSVLERLNSVLEPERKLSLAEKGGPVLEKITAHPNFLILATMNPGGDYGKKELSPALRNRFTEIWVPSVWDSNELRSMALGRFSNPDLSRFVDIMISFWEWFNQLQIGRMLTVRDLLSWVDFINATEKRLGPECAFLHGGFLCLLDGLSLGTGISKTDAGNLRKRCLYFLSEKLKLDNPSCCYSSLSRIENYGWAGLGTNADVSYSDDMQFDNMIGINPFYIEKGKEHCVVGGFEFLAPTTRRNALRLLRAMQLPKPVLLEGSPGVGKTSLIVSWGKFSGHKVVRINLSEQTDIMDLLGSDLPVESDNGMKFAWSDGILLQALKEGCWVLLDELNLAPQSVLEGLNALLDHRAEVFIPELGCTFRCPSSFRIFACQNPSNQGGGRKCLPKSFLNRFIKVYVDELVDDDYLFICRSLYPSIPRSLLSKLILFNKRLHEETVLYHKFAHDGSPWEFNLRDVIRSCEMILGVPEKSKTDCFLNILYVQRMRTATDRKEVLRIYEEVFEVKPFINPSPQMQLTPQYVTVGNSSIKRNCSRSSRITSDKLKIMPGVRQSLEAAMHCVQHQWLCILIGPSSSGKTSLIRLLSQLSGNKLNELNLSSATDVSELLGCFEQYSAYREFRYIVSEVKCYMNEYCSLQLDSPILIGEKKDLFGQWLTFLSNMDYGPVSSFASMHADKGKFIAKSLCFLLEIIEKLNFVREKFDLPVSWSSKELNKIKNTISNLLEDFQSKQFPAKFVWVIGLLIKALKNGEWIVLENANLCNPSVLDRINSLVEPCGSVTVNECGTVDGEPVVMHPHPNFRIFLTVNPTFGELSRAMRNRGVEIFLMPPYWLFEEGNKCSCEDFELKDVKRFLVESGIPVGKLVSSMAEAHLYAKTEGLRLSVHLSYLELGHWVQLFQQLIVNGNQPIWSLHVSWEHIYISSLGEAEGWAIVNNAKCTYLSDTELSKPDSSWGYSLCLPGGWPMPLKLRDLICYSREASVIQKCSYLGFLGAQYASCKLATARNFFSVYKARASSYAGANMMDMSSFHEIMHAKASAGLNSDFDQNIDSKSALGDKMLFAANWTIEQVSQSDLNLYLLWFSWFGTQLDPFCNFFKSFSSLLEEELEHPIWKCIHDCRRECKYLMNVDQDNFPMLSLDLDELPASDKRLKMSSQVLCRAIDCIGLLRLSFQQWSAERMHDYSDATQCYKPMLKSLQVLEKNILDVIVSSPSFDLLLHLYTNLLDNHISFWKCVALLQCKDLPISWRSLMKHIVKLQNFFPSAANTVLMEVKNLQNILHFNPDKSLLWVHGGHPFVPSSSNLHYKQHQLLVLCELLWPTERRKSLKHVYNSLSKVVASSNPELRSLAVQGICLSSYIVRKCDNDTEAVAQLENIYKMFLGRFDQEKLKVDSEIGFNNHTDSELNTISCCGFSPDIFCRKSSLDSWLSLVPIIDWSSFFMDIELLEKLSSVLLLDSKALKLPLDGSRDLLDRDLNFSLKFSSRPPQCFSPHKKITLMLDGWGSVDAVDVEAASFVLEMWYRWHQYMWSHHLDSVKKVSSVDGYDGAQPYLLTHPVITSTIVNILEDAFSIKDYSVCCLKLEAASWSVWSSTAWAKNLPTFLLSAARSLFEQIIYAHRRSFDAEVVVAIKSTLCSFKMNKVMKNELQHVSLLIASSSHQPLKSLVNEQIEPLLQHLFLQSSSTDFNYNLGCAWLRIGGLRFHLLFSCADTDPAHKYSWKCLQLQEKISSLELEIKVRKDCNYLAGSFRTTKADDKRSRELENLKLEHIRMQRKVVFRSGSKMFKKLKHECGNFFNNHFEKFMALVRNIGGMGVQQIVSVVSSWQEDATCFIEQLLDKEYTSYVDIIQPVQVAIYEMKLGLSLVLSSALQKAFLKRLEEDKMNRVMETIYAFMRFPRGCTFGSSVNLDPNLSDISSFDMDFPQNSLALDTTLLEKLLTVSSDASTSKTISDSQTKAVLHLNILSRVTLSIGNSRMIDKASFMLLDKIFNEFANMWMHMKVQANTRGDSDAQQYKFRPHAFTIDSVIEDDMSGLDMFLSDVFSKSKESEEEEETLLNNMVCIHNQLFGSTDIVNMPGNFQVYDADRVLSFSNSYKLGVGMIKGLVGLSSSCLDAKLVPEHLFRLCLEHKELFVSTNESTHKYNFYKDSNVPMMFKMFRSLTSLRQQIVSHISEWEDHAGLQKILDVVEMLLAIPSSTPLAKALSGLQVLLNKIWAFLEIGPKFPLTALEHIIALVSTWQKMEFDSWPTLLDAVQDQYEISAGKLWFPLYSVLQRSSADNIGGYTQSTIHSLEEFIHTSSVGEFRKRLQLLLAFHGQINARKCFQTYSSDCIKENLMTLYNVFGFYMQFLPLILEHIETNRRKIETEVKDVLKLCQWERFESVMSFENSKRTRYKFMKLIQKYNDVLQQPVMLILTQEAAQRTANFQSLRHSTALNVFSENAKMLNAAMDLTLLKNEDRFTWLANWKEKVHHALQNLHPGKTSESNILSSEGIAIIIAQCSAYTSIYQEEWSGVWHTLEHIYESTSRCCSSWNNVSKKRLGKRRDLESLLKLLESSGLRSHGFTSTKDQLKPIQLCLRFLGPSYDVHHLLLEQSRLSPGTVYSTLPREFQGLPHESLNSDWKTVNEYYFKSLASVMVLQQVCLKFHKDFTLEQVDRSASFLDHLISIQQEQRDVAYSFADHLKCLQKYASAVGTFLSRSSQLTDKTVSMGSISHNMDATLKCMWQQKLLFDSLYEISNEELLLLRTVESVHSKECQSVKVAANRILEFITKFNMIFLESKESLDKVLLGHNWAIRPMSGSLRPHVVSPQEEELVAQNFEVIKSFEEHLFDFRRKFDDNSIEEALLFHFDDVLKKGKLIAQWFSSSHEMRNGPTSSGQDASSCNHKDPQLGVDFSLALKRLESNAINALKRLSSLSDCHARSESFGNIATCGSLFETYVASLNVDQLCDDLETIFCAEGLLSHSGHGVHLQHLHVLLDLLLDFSDCLLQDFLAVHKTVSILTRALANVFAPIYSQGFGDGIEDQVDDTNHDVPQDASGTGIGEGGGSEDVTAQINDEDQLEWDFLADSFSVGEDLGEDEDGDDNQLEPAMGDTDKEVIDEKLWENPDDTNEKYESGSSVENRDASSRELRAKEDGPATADELGDLNSSEADEVNDETDSQVDLADAGNVEEMKVDNEDIDMDDKEVLVSMEKASIEEHDESTDNENHDRDMISSMDEKMEEAKTEQRDGAPEMVDPDRSDLTNTEMNLLEPRKDMFEPGSSSDVLNAESASPPKGAYQAPESKWLGENDVHSDPAATRGLPSDSTSKMDQQKIQLPQYESSAVRKNQPNPYRDIWDALEEWKERVNLTVDLQTENMERQDEMEDEYAEGYRCVSHHESGTDQAVGSATLEQLDKNVNGDDLPEIEDEKLNTETNHIECPDLSLEHKMGQMQITGPENLSGDGSLEDHSQGESLVSVNKSYFCDDLHQLSQLSVRNNEANKSQEMDEISTDVKNNASALWRRCELRTTRLSQELAEQLRFVLEPTVASKLQGDYRTGKRMNMKKVIPYIASHYRKNKIWMRRTRPNKRDYQVVIAVDDSHSMSESGCGDVAIEALVTVCRAMSQLEMGNLAVASFGQNGNIRLLHDFNQPFTGEAGVKMISSFTFKQENTITDEPVVDLLKYLNILLDDTLSKAWLPSGSNPLQQLVLIIADGQFHEKEKLKRCVRDALSQKRMVAFLLLDSPHESIMDLMEASFHGGDIKFTKYLDSFPFPYYIVLKDIEALPRTLADLLRQWFELMQNSRDGRA